MISTHFESDLIVAVIQNKTEAFFMKKVNFIYFTKVIIEIKVFFLIQFFSLFDFLRYETFFPHIVHTTR